MEMKQDLVLGFLESFLFQKSLRKTEGHLCMWVCRASELKAELARLSLPVYGSRKQLEERLMNHYETAMQEDNEYEALAQQVLPPHQSQTMHCGIVALPNAC